MQLVSVIRSVLPSDPHLLEQDIHQLMPFVLAAAAGEAVCHQISLATTYMIVWTLVFVVPFIVMLLQYTINTA